MMLTNKRKQRDRKRLFVLIAVFSGLCLFGAIAGFVVSWQLFYSKSYLSPLSTNVMAETSTHEEEILTVITQTLAKQDQKVQSIKKTQTTYQIVLENGSNVILSSEKDLNPQLSSLQFILQRLTMEGRRFSRLDLSFDKPVIVLEQ